ncbi:hypothetical protein GCM10022261_09270 [Brevibacterium daeguense]|uniref:YrhK domain-containing protein n=1 Tax=Brevibacterium daeguense TaxID=909936 RepID=A0ABP8EHP6_9MICO|nr:YrhK family protein [Brevibacterium daeguense]
MRFFDPRDRQITPQQAQRYAKFEILHTAVDFLAAFLFVIGSILFFSEQTKMAGTVCFLVGSIFFATKPSIRIVREIWLARLNRIDHLAAEAPEGPGDFEELTDDDEHGPAHGEHAPIDDEDALADDVPAEHSSRATR